MQHTQSECDDKAVTGRRETAVYLAQLLVVQLTQEEYIDWWSMYSHPYNYHTSDLDVCEVHTLLY